eukprot:9468655-Pyramimonas_sp.AAC.1
MSPEKTIGSDSTFVVDSLFLLGQKPPPLWSVAMPCCVMLRVDLQHHAMPCSAMPCYDIRLCDWKGNLRH